jgi:MFS family permease
MNREALVAGARRTPFHYGWMVAAAATGISFVSIGMARHAYSILLPPMKAGMGLNYTEAGLLATGNFLGYLVFTGLGGALATRFGTRHVVGVGAIAAGLLMILVGMVNGFVPVLVARTLTGMASGLAFVPGMALISTWFSAQKRGLATGIALSGIGVGVLLTGTLVPSLIDRIGWRAAWEVLGVVALVVGAAAWVVLRDHPSELGLAPVGGEALAAPAKGRVPWGVLWACVPLRILAGSYFLYGFSYTIFSTFFATHLTKDLGYSAAFAGQLWAVTGAISILSASVCGWLSDRIGRRAALMGIFTLQAVSYTLAATQGSLLGVSVSVVLYGLTANSITVVMAAACGDHLGPRLAPAALGVATMVFGVGQTTAPSVAGRLADVTNSFSSPFLMAAAVAALAVVASALLQRPPAARIG